MDFVASNYDNKLELEKQKSTVPPDRATWGPVKVYVDGVGCIVLPRDSFNKLRSVCSFHSYVFVSVH